MTDLQQPERPPKKSRSGEDQVKSDVPGIRNSALVGYIDYADLAEHISQGVTVEENEPAPPKKNEPDPAKKR